VAQPGPDSGLARNSNEAITVVLMSDNAGLARALSDDFKVRVARTDALGPAEVTSRPNVYLVDVTGGDRLSLVEELAIDRNLQVVVYGAADRGAASLRYLDVGACDYISTRTAPMERSARIRAAARRSVRTLDDAHPDYQVGAITVSLGQHEVRKDGQLIPLTPNEFRLLEALLRRADQVIPHRDLMAHVWGPEHLTARHYLRVYIRQLREKLEDDPDAPQLILTEWGAGYRLNTRGEQGATAATLRSASA
jgi:two-component system, OmpR family, KDP operon response regulator KdpE